VRDAQHEYVFTEQKCRNAASRATISRNSGGSNRGVLSFLPTAAAVVSPTLPGGSHDRRDTLTLLATATAGTPAEHLAPPVGRNIEVAFVLSEGAVMIDFAGPWEVFQDAMPAAGTAASQMPFELYTVAPGRAPLHTSGCNHKGMTVVPDFTFEHAPRPDIVVVGAQSGGAGRGVAEQGTRRERLISRYAPACSAWPRPDYWRAKQQPPTTWRCNASRINIPA
jgi:hypothetical protein